MLLKEQEFDDSSVIATPKIKKKEVITLLPAYSLEGAFVSPKLDGVRGTLYLDDGNVALKTYITDVRSKTQYKGYAIFDVEVLDKVVYVMDTIFYDGIYVYEMPVQDRFSSFGKIEIVLPGYHVKFQQLYSVAQAFNILKTEDEGVIVFLATGEIAKYKKRPTLDLLRVFSPAGFYWQTGDHLKVDPLPSQSLDSTVTGKIYECFYEKGRWFPLKLRSDKEKANTKTTYDSTMKAISAMATGWVPFIIRQETVEEITPIEETDTSLIARVYISLLRDKKYYFSRNSEGDRVKQIVSQIPFFGMDVKGYYCNLIVDDCHDLFVSYLMRRGYSIEDFVGFPLLQARIKEIFDSDPPSSIVRDLSKLVENGYSDEFFGVSQAVYFNDARQQYHFLKPFEINNYFDRMTKPHTLKVALEDTKRTFGLDPYHSLDFLLHFKSFNQCFLFRKKDIVLSDPIVMPPIDHPHVKVVERYLFVNGPSKVNHIKAHLLVTPPIVPVTAGYVRSICSLSHGISYFEGEYFRSYESLYDEYRDIIFSPGKRWVDKNVDKICDELLKGFDNLSVVEVNRRKNILNQMINDKNRQ
jgi:hypothetical protein